MATSAFLSIQALAERWACSRRSVMRYLRDFSAEVVDFSKRGKRGHLLVPIDHVERIERQRSHVFR